MTQATELAPGLVVQGIQAPLSLTHFKLIAFDMDSTLINIECVDEIADAAGRKAEVQRFPVVIWSSLLAAVSSVILQDLPLPVI